MSEMVKRAAAVILSALSEGTLGRDPDRMERVACVVLRAIRRPTEAMVRAGNRATDFPPYSTQQAEIAWRAMIDEALK